MKRTIGRLALLIFFAALPAACYSGSAHDVSPRQIAADPSWALVRDVPFVKQDEQHDCGAAALAMVLSFWRLPATAEEMRALAPPGEAGISAGALRDVARGKGLQAFVVEGNFLDLRQEVTHGRPVVVGLAKPTALRSRAAAHYEVVVGINRDKQRILTLDPARGLRENSLEGFAREWIPAKQLTLIVMPPRAPSPSPAPALAPSSDVSRRT